MATVLILRLLGVLVFQSAAVMTTELAARGSLRALVARIELYDERDPGYLFPKRKDYVPATGYGMITNGRRVFLTFPSAYISPGIHRLTRATRGALQSRIKVREVSVRGSAQSILIYASRRLV